MTDPNRRTGEPPRENAAGSGPEAAPPPRPGYIPRPPSRADIERISEAQSLLTDEWAGDAPRTASAGRPALAETQADRRHQRDTEGHPS